jgi:hypothetical protein
MGSVPFAFSVHSFVSSVGSDAGFAAIIGLAILVLLYFAQARETATLREQAYESAQRVDHLEARLAQLARQTPASAAIPVAAAPAAARAAANSGAGGPALTRAAVPAVAVTPMVGAPAGVAAPALSAATRLIAVGAARHGGMAAVAPSRPASPSAPGTAPPLDGRPVEGNSVGSPPPVTAAGATNGVARERVASPPAAAPPRPGGEAPRPTARPPVSPAGPKRPFVPPPSAPRRRSRFGRMLAVLVGLLVVAGAVVVLLLVTSGTGPGQSTTAASRTTNAPGANPAHRLVSFNPARVTVAVLNGTATAGLAGRTSRRLIAAGYKPGAVATATDQTHTATVVAYLPGYRADALRVAGALKLPVTAVQAIDQSARAVACPPPSACSTNVVVTVGSDLASA